MPLHPCWLLLTVTAACCFVDLASSSDINEEVMEEQPWTWKNSKLSEILGFSHSDGNSIDLNEAESREQRQNADYIYDVEGRTVISPEADGEFVFMKAASKRSPQQQQEQRQQFGVHRRNKAQQGRSGTRGRKMTTTTTEAPATNPPPPPPSVLDVDDFVAEPIVLPLLGSHAAVSKLNKQKDALLRKLLRQAARRQSMKRSPNCMRKCIAQGLLHPAQCHSLC